MSDTDINFVPYTPSTWERIEAMEISETLIFGEGHNFKSVQQMAIKIGKLQKRRINTRVIPQGCMVWRTA